MMPHILADRVILQNVGNYLLSHIHHTLDNHNLQNRISSDDELHCNTDMTAVTMLPTMSHRENLSYAYCVVVNHTFCSNVKTPSQTAFYKYINTCHIMYMCSFGGYVCTCTHFISVTTWFNSIALHIRSMQ